MPKNDIVRPESEFTFTNGKKVVVHETSRSDLERLTNLSIEAAAMEYKDAALSVYATAYYPALVVCTDEPPSLEDSYNYNHEEIDAWFAVAGKLNEWIGERNYTEEKIKIGGRTLVVKSFRPSVDIRLAKAQEQIKNDKPLEDLKDEEYRVGGYAVISAASFGKVPTAYQTNHDLGITDFNLWHKTVRRLIPEWFESDDEASAREKVADAKEKKTENAPAE